MKRFKGIKGAVILIILAAMIVSYYFYLSNKSKPESDVDTDYSLVNEVLAKNLKRDYPPSPKEVVRYYSEISKCFYNETYTEDQLIQLVEKSRTLLDEQLLEKNPEDAYLEDLKADIDEFKLNEFTISSYSISNSIDVEYFKEDGSEWARLYCTYNIRQKTEIKSTPEVYLLRKDADGHWKIFGWDLAEVQDE